MPGRSRPLPESIPTTATPEVGVMETPDGGKGRHMPRAGGLTTTGMRHEKLNKKRNHKNRKEVKKARHSQKEV